MEHRPIAYQVYSARKEAEKDLLSVLKQLKAMGYDGVEFAGFYGHAAEEVKAMLDETGLVAISSHVPLTAMLEDMDGQIAFHKTIGCKYMAIPHVGPEYRADGEKFAELIRLEWTLGKKCKENGIQLLYHNHDFEFMKVGALYSLDFMYQAVCRDLLKPEFDTCWIRYAGEDPVKYLRNYAGDVQIIHLKDYVGIKSDRPPYALIGVENSAPAGGDMPFMFKPVGYGCQDVKAIVEAGIAGGAQWFIVEQDDSPERPALESAKMSIGTLMNLGLK